MTRVARWQYAGIPPRSVQRDERRTYAYRWDTGVQAPYARFRITSSMIPYSFPCSADMM